MIFFPFCRFEDLEDKTHSIIGYCDDEINKTLHEISRYSTIDSKTIPSAKVRKLKPDENVQQFMKKMYIPVFICQ